MDLASVGVGCLAVAGGWRAVIVLADVREAGRAPVPHRVLRPELGWTDADLLGRRRRWAMVGLLAAALLLIVQVAALTPFVATASAATTLVWLARDRALHHGRYTTVCIATLAVAVGLHETGLATGAATTAGGLVASVAAGQLYLVAGIRKLRSSAFMSGRVLVDNVAFCTWRARAGDRNFVRLVPSRHLPTLLGRAGFRRGCRLAAAAAAGAEILVGAGAIGLWPFGVTIALAIPLHVGFLLLGPSRLLPFTAGALGLLFLSTAAPLVPVWG